VFTEQINDDDDDDDNENNTNFEDYTSHRLSTWRRSVKKTEF